MRGSKPFSAHAEVKNANCLGDIEYAKEYYDCDQRVQAMGYVGEHSERVWLYRLIRDLELGKAAPGEENVESSSISSVNYFQDESNIVPLEDVDLLGHPHQHIADQLVDGYFQTVHSTFPFIEKTAFLHQYRSFYSNRNKRPEKRWLAILNLIMAISARHSLLVDDQSLGNHDQHRVYFSRSWQLGMSGSILSDDLNLQQVQIEALTAFYLLSIGQVHQYVMCT
jgi:hypothetical protein